MTEKKKNVVTIFLVIPLVVLATVQVIFLNTNSTNGEKLARILEQTSENEKENAQLSQKIASASGLATIAVIAKESGFISNTITLSLSAPLPIAFLEESSL